MNLNDIDFALESYLRDADETDAARLKFFRKVWGVQAEHTPESSDYEVPNDLTLSAAFHGGAHVLDKKLVNIEEEKFVAAIEAIATCFVEEGSFDDEVVEALNRTKWDRIVTASKQHMAGKNPGEYLDECFQILQDDGLNERCARIATLTISYALRTQIEPTAKLIEAAYTGNNGVQSLNQRTCPVCGTAPTMAKIGSNAELMGKSRVLWCSQCGSSWPFDRIGCARCGCQTQIKLHQHNIEGDEAHRIASCDECGGYIRTYLTEGNTDLIPFSFEVEDIAMAHLDAIALDPKYTEAEEATEE